MMRELAEHLTVAVNSVTNIVDNLEKKVLVRRQRSEQDRRVIRVELTAAGREMARFLVEVNLKLFRGMLGRCTEDEQEIFMVLFRKIPEGVVAGDPDGILGSPILAPPLAPPSERNPQGEADRPRRRPAATRRHPAEGADAPAEILRKPDARGLRLRLSDGWALPRTGNPGLYAEGVTQHSPGSLAPATTPGRPGPDTPESPRGGTPRSPLAPSRTGEM